MNKSQYITVHIKNPGKECDLEGAYFPHWEEGKALKIGLRKKDAHHGVIPERWIISIIASLDNSATFEEIQAVLKSEGLDPGFLILAKTDDLKACVNDVARLQVVGD